jgi:hypothetical protein
MTVGMKAGTGTGEREDSTDDIIDLEGYQRMAPESVGLNYQRTAVTGRFAFRRASMNEVNALRCPRLP